MRRAAAFAALAISRFGCQYASVILTTRSKLQRFSSMPAATAGVVPRVFLLPHENITAKQDRNRALVHFEVRNPFRLRR